jgi:hypothetical protein
MATDRHGLSEAELEHIYVRRIQPDLLDGAARSNKPTAVLAGGQPGSGKSYAVAKIRAHLAQTIGPSVLIAGDDLRHYHPHWRNSAQTNVHAAAEVRPDVGRWYARLSTDAIAQGVNVVYETSMRQPQVVLALTRLLKGEKYEVAAVVLATDRDQSRQATMTQYDVARSLGSTPRFVSAADHDAAYDGLRDTLGRLEAECAVDRLQLVARDGRQLYANQLEGGRWLREPKAASMLDDFRERRLTATELSASALRWQTLTQRLAVYPSVPREVASQVLAWRNEATAKAERDPQAQRLLAWGREAEAFRTMNRYQFLREFPQYAKAVDRLDEAHRYAEQNFGHAADRERFIEQTRERLAERIAEGRFSAPDRASKERDPKTR